MPNWVELSVEDLNAYKVGDLMAALRTEALAAGQGDPFDELFADAVAHIRRKIAASGSALDRNQAKIPKGLKAVGCRRVIAAMKGRLEIKLTDDEVRDQENDNKDLNRIAEGVDPVDKPDNPDTGDEIPASSFTPQITARERRMGDQDGI